MAKLLGYNILKSPMETVDFDAVKVIKTINPHSYCISKKDALFEAALKASDVLLPDGIGIVWAECCLNHNKISKIAGYDVFVYLMEELNKTSGRCFFLGAAPATLQRIQQKAAKDYPKVVVGSFSPPYKPKFTEADSALMCAEVNAFKPDVLFVGMTAPKQEKWVHENKARLDATTICAIGAVFDFYTGKVKRPSKGWINLGLEWLPRFLQEPGRLFKRNFFSTPKFIIEVLCYKMFGKGIL